MAKKRARPKRKAAKKQETQVQQEETHDSAYVSDALKSLDELSKPKKEEDTSRDGSSKPDLMLEKEEKTDSKKSVMGSGVIETNSDHKEIMQHIKSIYHISKWTLAVVFLVLVILAYIMLKS